MVAEGEMATRSQILAETRGFSWIDPAIHSKSRERHRQIAGIIRADMRQIGWVN